MSINKTLFGLLFLHHQTRCGCIKYACDQCHKKNLNYPKKYNEVFYLDKQYFGKFDYKFLSNLEINSKILVFNKDMTVMYREIFSTIKPHGYSLHRNSTPILFQDIPIDLVNIMKKKDIILPRL